MPGRGSGPSGGSAGAPSRRVQSDLKLYVEDAAEQYADLVDCLAEFGHSFDLQAWAAAMESEDSVDRRNVKATLFCFTTLFNDVNEIMRRAHEIAGRWKRGRPFPEMRQVYADLARERLLARRRADRMVELNSVRNKLTHVYARVAPATAHAAIDEYLNRHHADLLRAAHTWLRKRGYRLL